MISVSKRSRTVGILGGGQLALMLANAAVRMGLKPIALAEDSSSPVALVHTETIFGSPDNEDDLRCLFSQVGLVVFENEFVNCEKIQKIAQEEEIRVVPDVRVIASLQDKLNQKKLLGELQIPTAEYRILDFQFELSDGGLKEQLSGILDEWGGRCVLKWARNGYDGKGVFVVDINSLDSLSPLRAFLAQAVRLGSPVYAERWIPFQRELAVIGVYSDRKEFFAYPLVISEQSHGVCNRVYGPAQHFGVSIEQVELAQEYAKRIAEAASLTGSFGVEFFQTQDQQLIVNEIAPRVHNSGHYTQNACPTDQFENHWRAVLGWTLGSADSQPGFAMLNLLGPEVGAQELSDAPEWILPEPTRRTQLHWYGKKDLRPGRKLGHLNGVVASVDQMEGLLKELEQCHSQWKNCLIRWPDKH